VDLQPAAVDQPLSVFRIRQKRTPHAELVTLQRVGVAIPAVEVPDERDVACPRRPLAVPHPRHTVPPAAVGPGVTMAAGELLQRAFHPNDFLQPLLRAQEALVKLFLERFQPWIDLDQPGPRLARPGGCGSAHAELTLCGTDAAGPRRSAYASPGRPFSI